MASTTPNIGLTLPTGAEKVSRQIINDNNTKIDTAIGTLNSNIEKVKYADYTIPLTSQSGRTDSIACGIAGYTPIAVSFLQNDDLYYLTTTDGIYPNLSISTGNNPYIQILGMNKSFAQVGATRNIKVRVAYTKN